MVRDSACQSTRRNWTDTVSTDSTWCIHSTIVIIGVLLGDARPKSERLVHIDRFGYVRSYIKGQWHILSEGT